MSADRRSKAQPSTSNAEEFDWEAYSQSSGCTLAPAENFLHPKVKPANRFKEGQIVLKSRRGVNLFARIKEIRNIFIKIDILGEEDSISSSSWLICDDSSLSALNMKDNKEGRICGASPPPGFPRKQEIFEKWAKNLMKNEKNNIAPQNCFIKQFKVPDLADFENKFEEKTKILVFDSTKAETPLRVATIEKAAKSGQQRLSISFDSSNETMSISSAKRTILPIEFVKKWNLEIVYPSIEKNKKRRTNSANKKEATPEIQRRTRNLTSSAEPKKARKEPTRTIRNRSVEPPKEETSCGSRNRKRSAPEQTPNRPKSVRFNAHNQKAEARDQPLVNQVLQEVNNSPRRQQQREEVAERREDSIGLELIEADPPVQPPRVTDAINQRNEEQRRDRRQTRLTPDIEIAGPSTSSRNNVAIPNETPSPEILLPRAPTNSSSLQNNPSTSNSNRVNNNQQNGEELRPYRRNNPPPSTRVVKHLLPRSQNIVWQVQPPPIYIVQDNVNEHAHFHPLLMSNATFVPTIDAMPQYTGNTGRAPTYRLISSPSLQRRVFNPQSEVAQPIERDEILQPQRQQPRVPHHQQQPRVVQYLQRNGAPQSSQTHQLRVVQHPQQQFRGPQPQWQEPRVPQHQQQPRIVQHPQQQFRGPEPQWQEPRVPQSSQQQLRVVQHQQQPRVVQYLQRNGAPQSSQTHQSRVAQSSQQQHRAVQHPQQQFRGPQPPQQQPRVAQPLQRNRVPQSSQHQITQPMRRQAEIVRQNFHQSANYSFEDMPVLERMDINSPLPQRRNIQQPSTSRIHPPQTRLYEEMIQDYSTSPSEVAERIIQPAATQLDEEPSSSRRMGDLLVVANGEMILQDEEEYQEEEIFQQVEEYQGEILHKEEHQEEIFQEEEEEYQEEVFQQEEEYPEEILYEEEHQEEIFQDEEEEIFEQEEYQREILHKEEHQEEIFQEEVLNEKQQMEAGPSNNQAASQGEDNEAQQVEANNPTPPAEAIEIEPIEIVQDRRDYLRFLISPYCTKVVGLNLNRIKLHVITFSCDLAIFHAAKHLYKNSRKRRECFEILKEFETSEPDHYSIERQYDNEMGVPDVEEDKREILIPKIKTKTEAIVWFKRLLNRMGYCPNTYQISRYDNYAVCRACLQKWLIYWFKLKLKSEEFNHYSQEEKDKLVNLLRNETIEKPNFNKFQESYIKRKWRWTGTDAELKQITEFFKEIYTKPPFSYCELAKKEAREKNTEAVQPIESEEDEDEDGIQIVYEHLINQPGPSTSH